jgi:hypothetical protein
MGAALAMLIVITALQPTSWIIIVLSGILCASPDLMWFPIWLREIMGKKVQTMGFVRRFHSKIQWSEMANLWGWISEVVWLCLMITLLSQNLVF